MSWTESTPDPYVKWIPSKWIMGQGCARLTLSTRFCRYAPQIITEHLRYADQRRNCGGVCLFAHLNVWPVTEECFINMALFFTTKFAWDLPLFSFPDGSVCVHLLHTRSGLLGAIRTQQNNSVISTGNIRCIYTKARMIDIKKANI